MIKLKKREVDNLLKLINNPEEKRIVKTFLKELERVNSEKPMPFRKDTLKMRSAKKALDVITKIGLEFGKHIAIETIIHLVK